MVSKIFYEFLNVNFSSFITIYTDGFVSPPLSAGYTFYIPALHIISFTNNLPPSSSSFTVECHAIMGALTLILNFAPDKYLITFDSMSCLYNLSIIIPFTSHLSFLVVRIKKKSPYTIQFLRFPSHIGIHGNEVADNLVKSMSNSICPAITQISQTDFTPLYDFTLKTSGIQITLISQRNCP